MLVVLTLVAPDLTSLETNLPHALEAVAGSGCTIRETDILGDGAADLIVEHDDPRVIHRAATTALQYAPIDLCAQPLEHRRKQLLVADMDSTIIGVECLDELADFAGLKAEVAAITERAMRGEVDFESALRQRVAMLKGLPLAELARAHAERVRLNPGARTLVRTMAADGARCVLVSGGFDFFTARVAEAAGFHLDRANRLIEADGALAGLVAEPILGREAKLAALIEEAAALGVDLVDTAAIGDGANDLDMIRAAGLGVAYRAKPLVAAEADARIDHADLTALLYFQGYSADRFVTD
ncbi:MAG TPA: phosphoserine phosphatase SerB [Caulobacteraceae bacterium]|jgi:phosphoserine phosphatase|nr:phosphoserine phosphatase SerB [Caulobacteraceae bacterium]